MPTDRKAAYRASTFKMIDANAPLVAAVITIVSQAEPVMVTTLPLMATSSTVSAPKVPTLVNDEETTQDFSVVPARTLAQTVPPLLEAA